MIGTTTDPQFVELFGSAFDDRDLGDLIHDHCLTNCRSVRRFRYGNIQTRRPLCQGLDQLIAARPLRTSYSRSRRPLDGLAGRVVAVFRDEGISGARGREPSGAEDDASRKNVRFCETPQISSDCVLKPAIQRPRTQS